MDYLNLLVKYFRFLLVFNQISKTYGQDQEVQQDSWSMDEINPKFKSNEIGNYEINSNTQKHNEELNNIPASLDDVVVGLGEDNENMNNYDDEDGYSMYKRDAQEHRENGKKKKITKKNKTVQGRILRLHKDRIKNKETHRKFKMLDHKQFKELFSNKVDGRLKNDKRTYKSHANHNHEKPLDITKTKEKQINMPPMLTQKEDERKDTLKEEIKEPSINLTKNTSGLKSKDAMNDKQTDSRFNSSAIIEIIHENNENRSRLQKKGRTGVSHQTHYTNEHSDGLADKANVQKPRKKHFKVIGPIYTDPSITKNQHSLNNNLHQTDMYIPKTYKDSKNALEDFPPENEISSKQKSTVMIEPMKIAQKSEKHDVKELSNWDYNIEDNSNTNAKESVVPDKFHQQRFSDKKGNTNEHDTYHILETPKEDTSNKYDTIHDDNNLKRYNEVNNKTYFKVYALGEENAENTENLEDQNSQQQAKLPSRMPSENSRDRSTNKKHTKGTKKKIQHREPLNFVSDFISNHSSQNDPKDTNADGKNQRHERDTNKRNHKSTGSRMFGYPKDNKESGGYNYGKEQEGLKSELTDLSNHPPQIQKTSKNEDYSSSQSEEEENEAVNEGEDFDSNKSFQKQFARRTHISNYFGSENGKEHCVDSYKGKKASKQTTGTTCTTEKATSTATCSTTSECTSTTITTISLLKQTYINEKTKTTPKIRNKAQLTKKNQNESRNDSSSTRVVDTFEQFLCGQLADDFVDAVLAKVKRSRKMHKELGFQNDTDDTCDRCIETKSNKMPSLETMKTSMEKFSDSNEQSKNCLTCYSVPKQMEIFLNLLISYEKELENNAYSKIRDDSSFIFTGDYPDQLTRSENSMENNDKYIGASNTFNKNTFDKQHFREENNEEKSDDQVSNRLSLDNVKPNSPIERTNADEYSTENVVEVIKEKDENSEAEPDVSKETLDTEPKEKDQLKSTLDLDEELKANDIVEEFDTNGPFNNKYSYYTGAGSDQTGLPVFSSNSVRRRKAFKSDIKQNPKNTYTVPNTGDMKVVKNIDNKTNKKRNFGFMDNGPLNSLITQDNRGQQHVYGNPNSYDSTNSQLLNSRHYTNNWSYNNDKLSPLHSVASGKYSKTNNHFDSYYPSDDYVEDSHDRYENNNNLHSISSDWGSNYRQLLNQPGDRPNMKHNSLKKKYYNEDYDGRLDMVKRDTDPTYEDEPLFFEVPDIEYDLY